MRILVTSPHAAIVGGTESYLDSLIPSLLARGHEIAHLHEHIPPEGRPRVGPAGIERICEATLGKRATLDACEAWRPDVIFQNGLEEPHLARALAHRHPSAFLVHDYHGTCVSGMKRFAYPSIVPCSRALGVGCLACYLPRRCGGRSPVTMFKLYALAVRRLSVVRRHDRVLVTSRHMRDEFARNGVAPERLQLIPYTAPGEPLTEPPPAHVRSDKILLIGRLTAPKGGPLLVRAIARAQSVLGRGVELVVAGEGPDRSAIENTASETGVSVRFEGWVNKERRARLYDEVDAIAVPSLWPEPFGLVGVEAAYVGVPSIAFDMGGITEWLTPGVSGEVAPGTHPSAEALGDAIVRTLRDPEHLARLRRSAWELSHRFTTEKHLAALEAELATTIELGRARL